MFQILKPVVRKIRIQPEDDLVAASSTTRNNEIAIITNPLESMPTRGPKGSQSMDLPIFPVPDSYSHAKIQQAEECIDEIKAMIGNYQRYTKPICFDDLRPRKFQMIPGTGLDDDNPYNPLKSFSPQKDPEQAKNLEFGSGEDVLAFFLKVGHGLTSTEGIDVHTLQASQRDAYLELKQQRQDEYARLNGQVIQGFSKMYYFIRYLKEVCDDQHPLFKYYKDNVTRLKSRNGDMQE